MNSLVRRTWLFFITAFLLSCEDPIEIGLTNDQNTDQVGVFFVEVPVVSSVLLADSVITSGTGNCPADLHLAGSFQDPDFGQVKATSYFQLSKDPLSALFFDSTVIDSVAIVLDLEYLYGTFVQQNTVRIHELTESLENIPYFNSDEIAYDPTPLGEGNFEILTEDDTLLTIRLDDALGDRLFDIMKDNPIDSVLDANFNGLALVGDDMGDGIFGSQNPTVRLYYRRFTEAGAIDTLNYDFNVLSLDRNFLNIQNDRQGTPIAGLVNSLSETTPANGNRYLQSGSGVTIKMDMGATIQQLKDTVDNLIINRAELTFEIDPLIGKILPPVDFSMNLLNDDNTTLKFENADRNVQIDTDRISNQLLTGQPIVISWDEENNSYTGRISQYMQAVFDGILETNRIALLPGQNCKTLDRFVVNADNIKLRLYYTVISN